MNFNRIVVAGALLLAGADVAQAAQVVVGNLAPSTAQDTVSVTVDGVAVAVRIPYRDFAKFDASIGTHKVSVDRITRTGAERLLETDLTIDPKDSQIPTLIVAGNGVEQPYSLELFQDAGGVARGVTWLFNTNQSIHHLAPFPRSGESLQAVSATLECRSISSSGTSTSRSGQDLSYGQFLSGSSANREALSTCKAQLAGEFFGGLELTVEERDESSLRVFLIGDDRSAPVELIAVIDGDVVALSQRVSGVPSTIVKSPSFWFDRDRPSQGVSLFEIRGAGAMYGTWYTHAADSHPVWYSLDGVASPEPGRRDVTIREVSLERAGGATTSTIVGSGVLQYIDCNNAELRVLIGNSDVRTLRLQRSRAVEACVALDR